MANMIPISTVIVGSGVVSTIDFTILSIAMSEPMNEDMQRRVPNISKIKALTGWQPENNLENIISDVSKAYI
jgi:nucleoside-diphosphate-sugar epimerase